MHYHAPLPPKRINLHNPLLPSSSSPPGAPTLPRGAGVSALICTANLHRPPCTSCGRTLTDGPYSKRAHRRPAQHEQREPTQISALTGRVEVHHVERAGGGARERARELARPAIHRCRRPPFTSH
eukprot:scaffold10060_cov30-Tisochrysis_lutea.AAC.1